MNNKIKDPLFLLERILKQLVLKDFSNEKKNLKVKTEDLVFKIKYSGYFTNSPLSEKKIILAIAYLIYWGYLYPETKISLIKIHIARVEQFLHQKLIKYLTDNESLMIVELVGKLDNAVFNLTTNFNFITDKEKEIFRFLTNFVTPGGFEPPIFRMKT